MAKAKKLPSGQWRTLVYSHSEPVRNPDGTPSLDSNGKQKKKRIYESFTGESKKESEYMASEYLYNKREKPKEKATLSEAMDNYCALKSNILSPTTLRDYNRMKNNCYEDIKNLKLRDISNDIIQNWTNEYSVGKSPKTVRNAHGFLSAVLGMYAPDLRIKTTLPQKKKTELYVPTDADIKSVLQYFKENDTEMELAVYLAAFGTLRRSEICALTADDVNGNTITVNKALVDKSSNEWVLKTTKTTSSTRKIDMPDFVITKLPVSGPLVKLTPNQLTRRLRNTLIKLDLPMFRFHDLRHYAASIMHAIGVPDQYIMQRGGWHSDTILKKVYRGTIDDYTKKYTDMTLAHFNEMQHEMQHDKENST